MRTPDQWVVREFNNEPGPVSDPVADLSVPGGALINGVWQRHDLRLPVTDPEDGRVLGYVAESTPADVAARNEGLKRLTRIVNPALFTTDGPYEIDPALQSPVLPGLAAAKQLAGLQPRTNEYGFLLTKLVRQRNRIHDALLQSCDVAEGLAKSS